MKLDATSVEQPEEKDQEVYKSSIITGQYRETVLYISTIIM